MGCLKQSPPTRITTPRSSPPSAIPALRPRARLLACPCSDSASSGIRAAVAHGRRFAIITIGPQLRSIIERMAGTHGASGRLVALRFLGISVLDAARDRAALEHAVFDAVHECVSQDGAEAVLLGGAPFAGLAGRLHLAAQCRSTTDLKRRSSWLSPRQGWISRTPFSRRRQKRGAEFNCARWQNRCLSCSPHMEQMSLATGPRIALSTDCPTSVTLPLSSTLPTALNVIRQATPAFRGFRLELNPAAEARQLPELV